MVKYNVVRFIEITEHNPTATFEWGVSVCVCGRINNNLTGVCIWKNGNFGFNKMGVGIFATKSGKGECLTPTCGHIIVNVNLYVHLAMY